MDKWDVFLAISALLTTAALIIKPLLKLNTSIVELNSAVDKLTQDLEDLKVKNSRTHDKLWNYCFMQDEQLNDHEERLCSSETNN